MLQHLGHVLADLAQHGAAAARARRRCRMHEALARQMRRQRPPCRPPALESYNVDFGSSSGLGRSEISLRLRLRRIGFEIGELKLKLLQDRAAFRGLPELRMAQLGDRELQLLDQQRVGLCFVLRRRSARLRCLRTLLRSSQRFALRRDGSARSRKRGRERIGSAWHAGDADTTPPAARAKSTT